MKKVVLAAALAMAAIVAQTPQALAQTACIAAPTPITVTGSITTNTTWSSSNIYLLSGFVYVESGATLTIQPGTIIKGDKASKGTLIVRQGGKLNAAGTAGAPIVFTSNQPVGSRDRGDWGGIILCGRAPQNIPATATQPLPQIEGGPNAFFGGTDPADNSGVLQYIRIEFAGVALTPNNEINGLTFGAVGNGTVVDHIQVSYSGDDSYEWFGGTVNCKYMVTFRGLDDEWDTDNGYSGKVQFGVALRDPDIADVSGSNGFESDNDANGTTNQPQTQAVFANMSNFIAPPTAGNTLASDYKRGMHIRRNSAESVFNSVSIGYPVGLLLDGSLAEQNATSGSLKLGGNVFAGYVAGKKATVVSGSAFNVKQFLGASNDTTATVASLNLSPSNFSLTAPNFVPLSTSPLATGSVTDAKLNDPFFTPVAYRGAFAPGGTNWTAGWTNFNPQTTCYNTPGVVTAAREAANAPLKSLTVSPNPTTDGAPATLGFDVKTATTATVRVVDMMGRQVALVLNAGKLAAGPQRLALPATLAPGVYLALVTTGDTVQSVRFVVAK